MDDPPSDNAGGFTYLMQFADGNRIDLGIDPPAMLPELVKDSQSILLLDKDGIVPPLPPASDRDYLPQPPTAKAFADCCNEFWWVGPYVAKGLWREEIAYAKHMQDHFVRDQLTKMLNWWVGVETGFAANPGKFGKYLQRYLAPDLWELLLKTYADASYERTWEALFAMCELFRIIALRVAAHFGFDYPHEDDVRVSAHLRRVRLLPKDAQEIY
jgi:aminoglycoside 6-adenylyltransferase